MGSNPLGITGDIVKSRLAKVIKQLVKLLSSQRIRNFESALPKWQ